jgi:hypothetical protein
MASPQLPRIPAQLPQTQAEWGAFVTAMQQWGNVLQASTWSASTLTNSWANYSTGFNPPGYRIDETGRVWLRGMIAGGASATAAFTLPFSPAYQQQLPAVCGLGGVYAPAVVVVHTSGDVLPFYNSGTLNWFSLDGLSFSLSP